MHDDDGEAGQLRPWYRGAAVNEQMSGVTGNPVSSTGHEPSGHDAALAGGGNRDQLALQRPVDLGQVQGDLGAPGLGHQADGRADASAWIYGRVPLTSVRPCTTTTARLASCARGIAVPP
jgi:hypothetical protein